MTDLSRLIDDICAGLDGPETPPVSTTVETLSTGSLDQLIDKSGSFHSFQSFHSENMVAAQNISPTPETSCFLDDRSRASSSYVDGVENAERVERGGKTLAGSTFPSFPLSLDEVERVERESGPCGRPLLGLNRAAPQRSDWWTGPLMAEVDRAAAPPSGTTLPIPPEKVRAGVERELRALADLGRDGPDALRGAIAITRAKIRNSEAIAERQAHDGRCHVCGEPLDDEAPMVAVLTAIRGKHLFMHSACHAEQIRRREALIDRIMAAAGYGPEQLSGEAA